MTVLLTGATGFIGRAVLKRLIDGEYDVTALVADQDEAAFVKAAGAIPFLGDEEETRTLSDVALESDGVIHLAISQAHDGDFIEAMLPGLEGGDKPFIYTGSIWSYGSNLDITEKSPTNPPAIAAWLGANEDRLRTEEGVRTIVLVPGIAYGHGQGIPRRITDALDTSGPTPTLPLIGDGSQHWATVHVDDLADLYVRVFEKKGLINQVYIGAGDASPTVAELGQAAARAAGIAGGAKPESREATGARLGVGLAEALLLDQHANADKAREDLGWKPTGPSLLDEITAGYTSGALEPFWD
jgi:Nucleoside-diphosphate-sugar epimerases